MATSEPLVPTGREYGARQDYIQAAQQAGVPLAPPTSDGPTPPVPNTPTLDRVPEGFDVLAGQTPALTANPPTTTRFDERRQRLLNSPNPFYRELAARIYGT